MFLGKLLRFVLVVVLLIAALGAGGFFWLKSRGLPQREGEAALAGLGAPVEVRWDRWAMPYVRAASAADATAALGWLHANDRMFQMEMSRRAASGRLSELFGERALGFDKKVRRLRIYAAAEKLVAAASPESRELLAAYAGGVNAWIETHQGDLPPEFRILGARPEPWRGADSMGIVFLMARQLSAIFEPNEEELFGFLREFGADRSRELAGTPQAQVFDEVKRLADETPAAGQPVGSNPEGSGLGSNNWAVAPGRSAARSAMVANDPHLGLGLPGVWFQAALRAPGYEVSGMTIPGVPGVVLGRSAHLAWAMTNLYVDDVDLFVERLDVTGTKVQRGEEFVPVTVEKATIRLDDGEEVEFEIRSTDRGPLLDPDPVRGLPARSVAWSGYEPADQMLALMNLARATTIAEVPAAVAPYSFPPQNLVVGDRDGHILWTPIGRAPNRFGWDGRFPAPGWKSEYGWAGLLPAAENPVLIDPADRGDRHREQLPAGGDTGLVPGGVRHAVPRRSGARASGGEDRLDSGRARRAAGRRDLAVGEVARAAPRRRPLRRRRQGLGGAPGLGRQDGGARRAGALRARRAPPPPRRLPGRGDGREPGALRHPLAADPPLRRRDVARLVRRRRDAGGRGSRRDGRGARSPPPGRRARSAGAPTPPPGPTPACIASSSSTISARRRSSAASSTAAPSRSTARRPRSWRSADRGSATRWTSNTAPRCAW